MISRSCVITAAACLALAAASCGAGRPDASPRSVASSTPSTTSVTSPPTSPIGADARGMFSARSAGPLHRPANLAPFASGLSAGEGMWRAAGRRVDGVPAVYETSLVPPRGSRPAGIAWMDTHLLVARLYSGSVSPGGGPFRYTAPIRPAQAARLVAAFNGGFKMNSAEGGYYTEHRTIDRLRRGAASLVIYADGAVNVGAWGSDVRMTREVVAVRQNLVPLVADGRPTNRSTGRDWQAWGNTCGAESCAASVPGVEHQWRSAVGVTKDGGLVYVQGPGLSPEQLAELLTRAGAMRGMELDINPDWPVFAAYDPTRPGGLARPSNGHLLTATVRGPDTFFDAWWARDFITMSMR